MVALDVVVARATWELQTMPRATKRKRTAPRAKPTKPAKEDNIDASARKRRRTTKKPPRADENRGSYLPNDVWSIILDKLVHQAFGPIKRTVFEGPADVPVAREVDRSATVFKARAKALLALRCVNKQLRALLGSDFGETLYATCNERARHYTDVLDSRDLRPASMLERHMCYFAHTTGCQKCDKHRTMRKPNFTFGVRMCKECLRKRTVIDRELENEYSLWAYLNEIFARLPHDVVKGWSAYYKEEYYMKRLWRASVANLVDELRRPKAAPAAHETARAKAKSAKTRARALTDDQKRAERKATIDAILAPLAKPGVDFARSALYRAQIAVPRLLASVDAFAWRHAPHLLDELARDASSSDADA